MGHALAREVQRALTQRAQLTVIVSDELCQQRVLSDKLLQRLALM